MLTTHFTSDLFGQQNKFVTGIEGGPSTTSIRWNDKKLKLTDFNKNPVICYTGGFYFQYNLPKYFSLYTSINIERKSTVSKGTWTDGNGNFIANYFDKSNFDFLTIPLLAKVNFGKKVKFFINVGPFVSYLIKETYIVEVTDFPRLTGDNSNLYEKFDIGVSEGLGLSIPIVKRLVLSCELRNNLGFQNIVKVPRTDFRTAKTNSTYFLIGFGFNLGKI